MRIIGPLAVGAVLTLTIPVVGDGSPDGTARNGVRSACEVEFMPARVTISGRTTRLLAEASARIGGLRKVRPAGGSGITVLETRPDTPPPDPSWVIALDLSEAQPGTWTLVLVGPGGKCAGEVALSAPAEPGR